MPILLTTDSPYREVADPYRASPACPWHKRVFLAYHIEDPSQCYFTMQAYRCDECQTILPFVVEALLDDDVEEVDIKPYRSTDLKTKTHPTSSLPRPRVDMDYFGRRGQSHYWSEKHPAWVSLLPPTGTIRVVESQRTPCHHLDMPMVATPNEIQGTPKLEGMFQCRDCGLIWFQLAAPAEKTYEGNRTLWQRFVRYVKHKWSGRE